MTDTEPVPLQDPRREYAELREEIDAAVAEVADSGAYVLGPVVERFEEAVAAGLGAGHGVGVASGTDALLLSLRALGVGEGDEVIVPAFTFFATAEAVLHAGAEPVPADVRPDTFNLDPGSAAEAVTDRTAALVPVHLFGQMADMDALGALAREHGLAVVEDAAQAHGARQEAAGGGTLRAGAAGDVGCFSFYPTKNLGGWGDGGMVVTDDAGLAARIRRLRDHGQGSEGYRHREVGYNSRLDALQAAILRVKLDRLEAWNGRRREHAAAYDEALAEAPGVRAPAVRDGNLHVYHQYTVRCRDRGRVAAHLDGRGVGHGVYYPVPLHLQEPLSRLGYAQGDFPEAERAAREVLSLPVFPTLTEEERGRVAEALRTVPEPSEEG